MVSWNVMNLLHRFGKPMEDYNDAGEGAGVALDIKACAKLYKRTLGSSLLEHIQALGHPTITSFLQSVFDEYHYAEYGVQLVQHDDNKNNANDDDDSSSSNTFYLSSTLSLRRARESASKASFLQFLSDPSSSETMLHTGATIVPDNIHNSNNNRYRSSVSSPSSSPPLPLGAAIRLASQSDLTSNRIQSGMDCRAFVLSYEEKGDNGSPLLICAIDSPKAQIREAARRRHGVRRRRDWEEDNRTTRDILARRDGQVEGSGSSTSQYTAGDDGDDDAGSVEEVGGKMMTLEDLQVGDGPIRASVVKISSKAGAAFVDLGVERKRGKRFGGGTARVLGMLRLDDVVGGGGNGLVSGGDGIMVDEEDGIEGWFANDEEGEEEVLDDITDLFSLDDDGNISMVDSPSATSDVLFESKDPSLDDEDDYDEDIFAGIEAEERLRIIGDVLAKEESSDSAATTAPSFTGDDESSSNEEVDSASFLCVGNEIDVYIRGVFTQSGRFMVTLDPSIKGRKVKELKREREASKRLTRLAGKKNSGGEGLQHILDSVGMECNGTVKAKSKAGDWYYVQPDVDEEEEGLKLPVGVAQGELDEVLSSGDKVWVRLDGIDESRGQLSMTLLKKISSDC